jgi:hypothetical protein
MLAKLSRAISEPKSTVLDNSQLAAYLVLFL